MKSSPSIVPAWKLWANPIFLRYSRSRLRPVGTVLGVVTVLIFLVPLVLGFYLGAIHWGETDPQEAARIAFPPILVVQAIILMLLGTGTVTLGFVREADEQIVDYQRLTPMSPMAKAMGYLFGLPLRAWLMFAVTLPFTIFCVVVGKMPLEVVGKVYAVFLSSTLLYHLTGLLAGTVLKKRLLAGILSMGIVFCVNFILPIVFARSGYVFLLFTTMWPVIQEQSLIIAMQSLDGVADQELKDLYMQSREGVRFFGFSVSRFWFSLAVQGFLIATFISIITRKWRDVELPMLGKNVAFGVYLGILVLFLGSSLPLMEGGDIFPSRNMSFRDVRLETLGLTASFYEGYGIAAFAGVVTLLIGALLVQVITPGRDYFLLGIRRANKLGRTRLGFAADESSGLWHAIAIALVGATAWWIFTDQLFSSKWYPAHELPGGSWFLMAGVFILATVCLYSVLQLWGRGMLWLLLLIFWILPLLFAGVLFAARQGTAGIYSTSPSAFAAFSSGLSVLLDGPEFPQLAHLKRTFWIWLGVHVLFAVVLGARLFSSERGLIRRVRSETS